MTRNLSNRVARLEGRGRTDVPRSVRVVVLEPSDPEPVAAPGEFVVAWRIVDPQGRAA